MPRQTLYVWDFASQIPGTSNKKLVPVQVFLPTIVEDGPSDPYVASILTLTTSQGECSKETLVRQLPRAVVTNEGRDFFPDLDGDDFAADFMHVFTTSRIALEIMRGAINAELGWRGQWRWAWQQKESVAKTSPSSATAAAPPAVWSGDWEPSPLRIIAHAGVKLGASYYRSKRALLFFVSPIPELRVKFYSCRSMSMVAHETGHAILDAIEPALYNNNNNDDARRTSDIIHEAFADACWMFVSLATPGWCAEVLDECKGQLRTPCRANQVGASSHSGEPQPAASGGEEEATSTLHDTQRSFLDPRTSWDCGRGVYHCANVFVAFLWDCLVRMHESSLFAAAGDAAAALHASAATLCHLFVRAVCRCVKSWTTPSIAVLVAAIGDTDAAVSILKSAELTSSIGRAFAGDGIAEAIAASICEIIAASAASRRISSLGESRAKQRAGMLGDW